MKAPAPFFVDDSSCEIVEACRELIRRQAEFDELLGFTVERRKDHLYPSRRNRAREAVEAQVRRVSFLLFQDMQLNPSPGRTRHHLVDDHVFARAPMRRYRKHGFVAINHYPRSSPLHLEIGVPA